MPKIIGFLGSYTADICLYTALAIQNTGKRVCVIDNSDESALYGCIPTPDKCLEMITYHNVDFIRREPFANWQDLQYQYVVVQLGALPLDICIDICSERIMVVDCERINLDYYSQWMRKKQIPMLVLLRGICPDGLPVRQIKERFEAENCFVEKWLTLPLAETDEAYRIRMQYEPIKKFNRLSVGMETVLIQLLRRLNAGNYAQILCAIRAVKNGKVIGITDINYNHRMQLLEHA